MKLECGECDSRVPRRAAAAHRMESKYKRQSELSELDERQERASEGLSSLDYHVNMRASAIRMHQDKREPDGNLSSLHQSAQPPCSCIGISGVKRSHPMSHLSRVMSHLFFRCRKSDPE